MKAWLQRKGRIFHLRLRIDRREYQQSLETDDFDAAKAALGNAHATLYQVKLGQLTLPASGSVITWAISGGKTTRSEFAAKGLTVTAAIQLYLDAERLDAAPAYVENQQTHLKHLRLNLGDSRNVRAIDLADLEQHLTTRRSQRSAQTAIRERNTLRKFFGWLAKQKYLPHSPATGLDPIKDDSVIRSFATHHQIEEAISRAKLDGEQAKHEWKRLFLTTNEIVDLLELVKQRAADPRSYTFHLLAAYTGMRRGEIIRLRWDEIDLNQGYLVARSRKQSRRRREVARQIALHPILASFLNFERHAFANATFPTSGSDPCEVTKDEANRLFWQPLRRTEWCLNSKKNWFKLGFHTYRHSFISNLAARGVDQRIIRDLAGHTSEQMQRRYLHIHPDNRLDAIRRL